ncbi:unnamed protein product, partial [Amoebophrya sp. A25]
SQACKVEVCLLSCFRPLLFQWSGTGRNLVKIDVCQLLFIRHPLLALSLVLAIFSRIRPHQLGLASV